MMLDKYRKFFAISALVVSGSAFSLSASPVQVYLPDGNRVFIDILLDDSNVEIKNEIETQIGLPSDQISLTIDRLNHEIWVEMKGEELQDEVLIEKRTFEGYRNYSRGYSQSEKKEIKFILKTLAQKSLTSLIGYKSQLEYAGEKIDSLHPLRFLECIFCDEELKVYIHNIKKKGSFIWSEFIKGLKESLQEEVEIGNITQEFIDDFSKNIAVDAHKYNHHIKSRDWEDFVKTLIILVPRNGDTGRYDQ